MIMAGASAGAVLVSSALTVDTPVAGAVTLLGYLFVVQAGLAGEFRSRVVGAVAAERRRIARDIHDGLAQELAFIVSQSQRLEGSGRDSDIVVHLQSAARRALQESRLAVAFLNADDNTPLDMLISQGVRAFQARSPVQVDLELASSVVVDAEKQTAMLRILNEAMSNGVRHGGAEHLSVRLEQDGDRLSLSVADDGTGFDVARACDSPTGWGLISMRERAELLGGRLRLFSRPASGTLVEVVLPHG
jgi:signal transduction histidine kinase